MQIIANDRPTSLNKLFGLISIMSHFSQ